MRMKMMRMRRTLLKQWMSFAGITMWRARLVRPIWAALNAIVRFLRYAKEKERDYLNPTFNEKCLSNLSPPRSAEGLKQNAAIKAMLKKADMNCAPIRMDRFPPKELGKYLRHIADNGDGGKKRGVSSLKTARSAIMWMISMFQLPLTKAFTDEVATLWQSFARTNAKAIAQGNGELKVWHSLL
jgi:hypothetical protein